MHLGAPKRDAVKLISAGTTRLAGPVAICNECIELCNQILGEDRKPSG